MYDYFASSSNITNTDWGIIQLMKINDKIMRYFEIDFNRKPKDLYYQYLVAIYLIDKKEKNIN